MSFFAAAVDLLRRTVAYATGSPAPHPWHRVRPVKDAMPFPCVVRATDLELLVGLHREVAGRSFPYADLDEGVFETFRSAGLLRRVGRFGLTSPDDGAYVVFTRLALDKVRAETEYVPPFKINDLDKLIPCLAGDAFPPEALDRSLFERMLFAGVIVWLPEGGRAIFTARGRRIVEHSAAARAALQAA